MFSTYILKSVNRDKFYTGYTNDLQRRLKEHNMGHTIYSKRFAPWEIVYFEHFENQAEAIKREKYLKSAAGKRWIKKQLPAKL